VGENGARVVDEIARVARAAPDRPALIDRDRRTTYGQLAEQIDSRAEFLAEHGAETGRAVGLLLPNRAASVATLLGTARAGSVAVLFPPSLTPAELRHYSHEAGIRLIISEPAHGPLVEAAGGRVRGRTGKDLDAFELDSPPVEGLRGEDFICQLTSGADQPPKIAIRSHRAVWNEVEDFADEIGITDRDAVLVLPSIAHSYGLIGGTLAPLSRGGRAILWDRFAPEEVAGLIRAERPTLLYGVPFVYRALATAPVGNPEDLASLRVAFSAGAPLPRDVDDGFALRYGRRIAQNYGTTEAGVISIRLEWTPELQGSVGRPVRHRTVTIVDGRGKAFAPGRGSVGGVIVESPALARGYLGAGAAWGGSALKDGRLLTGDLGWMSGDGYVFLTGRAGRVIRIAGAAVDPAEVERVIASLPGVREVAVVGVPLPFKGVGVKAVVVADGLAAADVIRHCRRHLASIMVPEIVEFRAALPRTPAGKILRRALPEPQ